jgi:4-amino-4-deoxy-L-arabinose transferase-like glycosyltransferase
MNDRPGPAGRPGQRPDRVHELGRPRSGTPVTPDALQVPTRAVVPAEPGRRRWWQGLTDPVGRAFGAFLARDRLVLISLLVIAALIRLVGLPGRGDFDGDQGHDMLTLLQLVRDGHIPLLGPPTSIGDFHHGAMYYFLFAPVAWLSGSDPVAVLAAIAALGTAAVGVTWWLARAIGGRAAGAMAGLLLAVSPAAVEQSTFIWNPNPIPFFAVVALAAAWRGHQTGRTRWWAVSVASAGMVVQLHVLGVVFLAPIVGFAIADVVAARRSDDQARVRRVIAGLAGGLAIVALMFVPLLVNEFQTGFGESRHALAYFTAPAGSQAGGGMDPVERLVFTGLRVIGWPLVGLVTSTPIAAILGVSIALVLGIWRMAVGQGEERVAARWLGLTIAWSTVALSVLAPSLQTVVAGLPNDHYHAFVDPAVVILVALGLRAAGSGAGLPGGVDRTARLVVAAVLVGILAFDVSRWPPLTQANGGWPAARDAGARIVSLSSGSTFDVRDLPVFKTAEGIGFPIVAAGGSAVIATDEATAIAPLTPGATLVIVCDRLFQSTIGSSCGGPAETRFLGQIPGLGTGADAPVLLDRFDASPRTSISVYQPPRSGAASPAGVLGHLPGGNPPMSMRALQ